MTRIVPYQSDAVSLMHPESWSVDADGGEVNLSRSADGGAITISTYRHSDPEFRANALEQGRRFIAHCKQDPGIVSGLASDARAAFEDGEGRFWAVRVVARGNRFALATFNANQRDPEEEAQMRQILDSIELPPST